MRRQGANNGSPSIIHTSSIALLQERFRKLERVKEMREGRELQRAQRSADTDSTGSGSSSSTSPVPALSLGLQASNSSEHPKWFLHPDLVRPSTRPPQGPATYNGLGDDGAAVQASQPAATSSYWRDVPRMQNSGYMGGDVDVDTSLHL